MYLLGQWQNSTHSSLGHFYNIAENFSLFDSVRSTEEVNYSSSIKMPDPQGPVKVAVKPQSFHGFASEDPKMYIDAFEEVAKTNRWTNDITALQFPNYMQGVALKWWRTYKQNLIRAAVPPALPQAPTWDNIKTEFEKAFISVGRQVSAELLLDARKQKYDESCESYFYDILELCDRIDLTMSKDRKIRHLLKGLRPYYLEKIMPLNPQTIDEVLVHMRRVAESKLLSDRNLEKDVPAFPIEEEQPDLAEVKEAINKLIKAMEDLQEDKRREKEWKSREENRRRAERRALGFACYICNSPHHMARDCDIRDEVVNYSERADNGDRWKVQFDYESEDMGNEDVSGLGRPLTQ